MDSLAVAFLGVIALSSLVQAGFVIGLVVQGRRLERRLSELGERIERDIQPAIAHLTRVTRNAAEVSDLAVVEVRRLDKPELVIELGRQGERTFARRAGDAALLELDSAAVDEILETLRKL